MEDRVHHCQGCARRFTEADLLHVERFGVCPYCDGDAGFGDQDPYDLGENDDPDPDYDDKLF